MRTLALTCLVLLSCLPRNVPAQPVAAGQALPVTAENFVRAESDLYFGNIVRRGGFGQFDHNRDLAAVDDKQLVVRSNRDTLYSGAVFDLDAGPVTVTLPDAGQRFISMQVIDEDQYTHLVAYAPGTYTLTRAGIGTRYVIVFVRIFVDPGDPADIAQVHALQDAISTDQPGGPGRFEVPRWDKASQDKVRDALLVLASTLPDQRRMFGSRDEVDPVRFLIGAAMGWAGNPDRDAVYLIGKPQHNDGRTTYELVVGDVPVDGFWSISLYDEKGYFVKNRHDAYSFNNITARAAADGSIRIQFGDCDDGVPNCLPTMPGWNYIVRLYRPRAEVLDGTWHFPDARIVRPAPAGAH